MSYTKGPWEVRKGMYDDALEIHSCANYEPAKIEICTVQTGLNQSFDREQKSNANLIAAAPELLEALDMIREVKVKGLLFCTGEEIKSASDAMDKAIAKARGLDK